MNNQPDKKVLPKRTTGKGSLGWLMTLFIVSGSMFFLGLLVGRGMSPVRFDKVEVERDLNRLKNTFAIPSPETKPEGLSDTPDLEFFEALKKQGNDKEPNIEFITKAPPVPLSDAEAEPAPAAGQEQILQPEPEKAVPPVVDATPLPPEKENETPPQVNLKPDALPEKTPEKEVSKPKEKPSPGYTIQVASYRQASDADLMVKELVSKGYPAYRSMGTITGKGIWFRVRVGLYETREAAMPFLEALGRDNIKGILLTK